MPYHHFTTEERYVIAHMHSAEISRRVYEVGWIGLLAPIF